MTTLVVVAEANECKPVDLDAENGRSFEKAVQGTMKLGREASAWLKEGSSRLDLTTCCCCRAPNPLVNLFFSFS